MNLDLVIERTLSVEFHEVAEMVAEELLAHAQGVVVGQFAKRAAEDPDEWENFYLPAMRRNVFRLLAVECRRAEDGWNTVFCNNVRAAEAQEGADNAPR